MGPGEGEVGGTGGGGVVGMGVVEADDVETGLRGLAVGVEDGEGVDGVTVVKACGVGEVFGGECEVDFDGCGWGGQEVAAEEDAAAFTGIFGGGVALKQSENVGRQYEHCCGHHTMDDIMGRGI